MQPAPTPSHPSTATPDELELKRSLFWKRGKEKAEAFTLARNEAIGSDIVALEAIEYEAQRVFCLAYKTATEAEKKALGDAWTQARKNKENAWWVKFGLSNPVAHLDKWYR
jgi:hypothetical protein